MSSGEIIFQERVDLVDGFYVTTYEHRIPRSVIYHISYLGAVDGSRTFEPTSMTYTKALFCPLGNGKSEPDLSVDGIIEIVTADELNADGGDFICGSGRHRL